MHRPVLLDEVIGWLKPQDGSVLVDGTVGAGGHAATLARQVGPTGRIIGLDRDPAMLALAKEATAGLPVTLVHAPYSDLGEVLDELGRRVGPGRAAGPRAFLGPALLGHRGFSFAIDGPLDMRFDPDVDPESSSTSTGPSRRTLEPEEELARLFFDYGEERYSRRSPGGSSRRGGIEPIATTGRLAELVRQSIPGSGAGSTRRPGSSRLCGSRSTPSSTTLTPPWPNCRTGSSPGAERLSSASTRWKIAG